MWRYKKHKAEKIDIVPGLLILIQCNTYNIITNTTQGHEGIDFTFEFVLKDPAIFWHS